MDAEMKPTIEPHPPSWCCHYRSLLHGSCRLGIAYASVKDESDGRVGLSRYPCFKEHNPPDTCPSRRWPTAEEIDADRAEAAASLERFVTSLAQDICPHCNRAITAYFKTGRSVYAHPCCCRLYQGQIPEGKARI